MRRYDTMLTALEYGGFALSSLVNDSWFAEEVKAMERDIRDFKRIRGPKQSADNFLEAKKKTTVMIGQ